MITDYIGKPLQLEGVTVVLVPDIIGAVPVTEQHEYVEIAKATNTCAAIFMREADIEAVRQVYPKAQVFGLWQTLIASQKVDVSSTLQVVPMNSHDGYYVHADVGRVLYSGNYDAGFFAADTEFRLSNANVITADINDLVLPKTPACLAKEILFGRKKLYRGTLLQFGALAGILFIVALAIDLSLQFYNERRYASIAQKDQQISKLQSALQVLAKNRLVEVPDQSVALERLAMIMHDFAEVEISGPIQMKSSAIAITLSAAADPAGLYPFVTSAVQPDGRWHVTIKLEG